MIKFCVEVADYIQVDDERNRPQYWSMNIITTVEDAPLLTTPIIILRNQIREYSPEAIISEALKQALPGHIIQVFNFKKEVDDGNGDSGHSASTDSDDEA